MFCCKRMSNCWSKKRDLTDKHTYNTNKYFSNSIGDPFGSLKISYNRGQVLKKAKDNSKLIYTALDDSGKGLTVKEIQISKEKMVEYSEICENLVKLINHLGAQIKHSNLLEYILVNYKEGVFKIITEKMSLNFEDIPFCDENSVRVMI